MNPVRYALNRLVVRLVTDYDESMLVSVELVHCRLYVMPFCVELEIEKCMSGWYFYLQM